MTQKHSEFYNLVGNSDGQTLNLSINEDIGDFWTGTDSETFASLLNNKEITQINVDINSRGGSVFEGVSIFNQLKNHPANVKTNVTGQAASIAAVIFAAGDERTMNMGSRMLIHPVSMEMFGSFDPAELRDLATETEAIKDSVADILDSASNIGKDEILNMMSKETTINDTEALEMGFATSISKAEAVNLESYKKYKPVNYKDDKEKIQQVLNNTRKILNNKPDKETVMEKKEFENRLAEVEGKFTSQINTLTDELKQAGQLVNTYKEQVLTLEGSIVTLNNKAIHSEFSNFIDGLVSQGKVTPAEKEIEIQNLELRRNDATMLDSYKELLNSKPAKFSLRANVANNGPENVIDNQVATPEEKAKQKELYAKVKKRRVANA